MNLKELKLTLKKASSAKKAKDLQWFFKTGPGEYAQGDIFIGIVVPTLRKISKDFFNLPLSDLEKLLSSPIHEERLISLFILIQKFNKSDEKEKQKIFDLYLKNTKYINNWDLVDLSAPQIAGNFLFDKNHAILFTLAKSDILWQRRISIIATFYFIKNKNFDTALKIAETLLLDKHDLIHKAVGWMLREIGKRDFKTEETFLKKHYKNMPRTMLRYAIEKFPENLRQAYLKSKI